jgi:hypothetical protein
MQITPIIEQLRAYCPSFASRIAGAAEYKALPESANLPVPAAYVLPLEDNPGPPMSENAVRQSLVESFAVVVALSNTTDERGQAAVTSLHDVRAELWRALLGWQLGQPSIYNGIYYEGASLLGLDRARMWYRFEFAAAMYIGPTDGWQEGALAALPALTTMHTNVDVIDPIFDPNLAAHGPDGRIEFQTQINNLDQ